MTNPSRFASIDTAELATVTGGFGLPGPLKTALKVGGRALTPLNAYTSYKAGKAGADQYFTSRDQGKSVSSSLKDGGVKYLKTWVG
jgi:hypothetical protein